MTFREKLPAAWQQYWEELGYETASPIQEKMYDLLLSDQNIVGVSPTGSGKTVAYLLPLLQKIKKGEGNQLLILLPSQELAVQVGTVTKAWGDLLGLTVQSLIGGANVKRQVDKLKEKPEVLVGTPGRVFELIKAKKVKAHLLSMIVLDEVDQLIESSELNATKNILKAIMNESQIVCVSATALAIEKELGTNWTKEIVTVDVSQEDQSAGTVVHGYIEVEARKKLEMIKKLAFVPGFKGIIFFNELQEMGSVSEKLSYQGVPNVTLASDQNKLERKLGLGAFAEDKVNLLLTTDIAARGLDFTSLPYVIHFDIPYAQENYVHRSGRTGRMGKDGTVISLVNEYTMRDLRKVTRDVEDSLVAFNVHSAKIVVEQPKAAHKSLKPVSDQPESVAEAKKVRVQVAEPVKKRLEPTVKKKKKNKPKDTKNKGARKKK